MPANHYLRDTSLVNEEVREILGTPPAWIARAGNMVLLGVVGIFFILASCIRYPELLYGRVVISPVERPVPVVLCPQAVIQRICVADGREVQAGQVLLYFQNRADGRRDSICAGVSGRVVLQRVLAVDQPVGADSLILTIIPASETYTGIISMPAAGAGKIIPGQEVRVYLDSYPGSEFGALRGVVLGRPVYKGDKQLIVNISMRSGQTTYGQYPVINGPMEGQAEVVTADRKLISQFLPF